MSIVLEDGKKVGAEDQGNRPQYGFRVRTPRRSYLLLATTQARPSPTSNIKGYSSTYLAMEFANVRAGTRYMKPSAS